MRRHEHDTDAESVRGWFTGRLPQGWFAGPVEVTVDREEITVVGPLAAPDVAERRVAGGAGRGRRGPGPAASGRTRGTTASRSPERPSTGSVARSPGASRRDGSRVLFTHLAVPVMTRLRQPQRMVLDTLVEAGVARSRSEALAWCVRLVGQHSEDWLAELREAMENVERVRGQGPDAEAT